MMTEILFLSLRALGQAQTSLIKDIVCQIYTRDTNRLPIYIQIKARPHPAGIKVQHSSEEEGGEGTQLGLSFQDLLPAICFTQPMIFTFIFISSRTQQIQIDLRESLSTGFIHVDIRPRTAETLRMDTRDTPKDSMKKVRGKATWD